jgi:hypothetical protein
MSWDHQPVMGLALVDSRRVVGHRWRLTLLSDGRCTAIDHLPAHAPPRGADSTSSSRWLIALTTVSR